MWKITFLDISPFVATSVILIGIYYSNILISITGGFLFLYSLFATLYKCGNNLRLEVENANDGRK